MKYRGDRKEGNKGREGEKEEGKVHRPKGVGEERERQRGWEWEWMNEGQIYRRRWIFVGLERNRTT